MIKMIVEIIVRIIHNQYTGKNYIHILFVSDDKCYVSGTEVF